MGCSNNHEWTLKPDYIDFDIWLFMHGTTLHVEIYHCFQCRLRKMHSVCTNCSMLNMYSNLWYFGDVCIWKWSWRFWQVFDQWSFTPTRTPYLVDHPAEPSAEVQWNLKK